MSCFNFQYILRDPNVRLRFPISLTNAISRANGEMNVRMQIAFRRQRLSK